MAMRADTYTDKQLKAARLLVEGHSRVEAYRKVYSTGSASPANVRSKSSHFFGSTKLQTLVQRLQAESMKRLNVTQDLVTRDLAAVAFASLPDLLETAPDGTLRLKPLEALTDAQRRAIRKVRIRKHSRATEDGGAVVTVETEIELHGKLEALELLGRDLGMFSQRVFIEIPRIDYRPEGSAPVPPSPHVIPAP